ncbi:hypothetical protein HNQ61_003244 [Longimicrobium terrae]|uniref:Uncharacterized protein n=1 Tax=Longimicrobium terrae TaxID=1639882 RepID=A0A841H0Y4_9BACT|nr:hypothetical protein [Longimicrobium terrae]
MFSNPSRRLTTKSNILRSGAQVGAAMVFDSG